MPKTKTHSGAKKRFKLMGTGKIKRRPAMRSHNLETKTAKRKRGFRKERLLTGQHISPLSGFNIDQMREQRLKGFDGLMRMSHPPVRASHVGDRAIDLDADGDQQPHGAYEAKR